jgi:hypothetical protein
LISNGVWEVGVWTGVHTHDIAEGVAAFIQRHADLRVTAMAMKSESCGWEAMIVVTEPRQPQK